MTVPISSALARFAAEARDGAVPRAVTDKVATHVLDVLGVQLAASRQDFAPAVREVTLGLGGPPESVGIGLAQELGAPNAALLNGTLAHGVDYDDTHLRSIVHPSATVTPAAMAVAEEVDADGIAVSAAIAAGLETAVRIGLAAEGEFHHRGFHATPIAGVFGAALAASMLYRLTLGQTVSALGLAASMAGGLLEFLTDGTSAKRLHGGWAAHGGVLAARLGRAGLSGPAGGLDGRFGLLPTLFAGAADPSRIGRGLGCDWEMLDIALKPYPCCHFVHAFLDGAAELREHLGVGRGEPAGEAALAQITAIECGVVPLTIPVVCEPRATKLRPQTPYDAQFSLPFSVAVMFSRGRVTLDEYEPETIADERLIALAHRVRIVPEPRVEFPASFPGRLRLELADGRSFESDHSDNRGGPGAPLSFEEVGAKFRANAVPSIGSEQAEAVISLLEARPLPSAKRIMAGLRRASVDSVDRRGDP